MKFKVGTPVKIVDVIYRHSDSPSIMKEINEEIKRIGMTGKIIDIFDEPDDKYPYCVEQSDGYVDWHNEEELEVIH